MGLDTHVLSDWIAVIGGGAFFAWVIVVLARKLIKMMNRVDR